MRNLLAFLLAMTLVLSGKMLLNPMSTGAAVPSEITIVKTEELTSFVSNQNNAVEQDGVRFEILVPERTWIIPDNKPDASTPVQLGIRITNNTPKQIRLSRFNTPTLIIKGQDGKTTAAIRQNGPIDPSDSDYPSVMPGESLNFLLKGQLFWAYGKYLQLSGTNESGAVWSLQGLKAGTYQLCLSYSSALPRFHKLDKQVLEEVWTGQVVTPFVEFYLVEAGIEMASQLLFQRTLPNAEISSTSTV